MINWLYNFILRYYEMTTVKLDLWSFEKEIKKRVTIGIRKWLLVLMEELKRLTPEDTKEMLNSYVMEWIREEWSSLIWSIKNDADYAIFVEYGIWWVSFNYHKPKWSVFYQWIGNRTFARAVDNVREKVMLIILAEIGR